MTQTRSDLTIRPATPADFDAVDELLRHSSPVLLKRDYPPYDLVMPLWR